jgi:TrmH family RNA methyltransferase
VARREHGVFLVEGVRLVNEAVAAGWPASLALYDPDRLSRTAAGATLLEAIPGWAQRAFEVGERVLDQAAQTETPSGIVAVLSLPRPQSLAAHREDTFGVILDGIAEPGNAGAILRTADAAGVRYVAAVSGTVDLFGPKVVRAGMGAHFHLEIVREATWRDIADALAGTSLVATDARGEESVFDFEWPDRAVLVVGGEAHGISDEARRVVRHRIRIPMRETVESLNAGIAASIAIYAALGPALRRGKAVSNH